jgi:hypothetical protein
MMERKLVRKSVEFYSKNKFVKLVHLVGFITRIYHNARSSECQTVKMLNAILQTSKHPYEVITLSQNTQI